MILLVRCFQNLFREMFIHFIFFENIPGVEFVLPKKRSSHSIASHILYPYGI